MFFMLNALGWPLCLPWGCRGNLQHDPESQVGSQGTIHVRTKMTEPTFALSPFNSEGQEALSHYRKTTMDLGLMRHWLNLLQRNLMRHRRKRCLEVTVRTRVRFSWEFNQTDKNITDIQTTITPISPNAPNIHHLFVPTWHVSLLIFYLQPCVLCLWLKVCNSHLFTASTWLHLYSEWIPNTVGGGSRQIYPRQQTLHKAAGSDFNRAAAGAQERSESYTEIKFP